MTSPGKEGKPAAKGKAEAKKGGKPEAKKTEKLEAKKAEKLEAKKAEKLEGKKSGKQDVKKSAKPDTKKSAKPDTKKPAKPDTKKPAKPDTKKPAKPDTKKSAKPDVKKSAKPDVKKAGKAVAKKGGKAVTKKTGKAAKPVKDGKETKLRKTKKSLKPGTIKFGLEKRKIIRKILKPRIKKSVKEQTKTPLYITKPIGGEKNGGTRTILVKKPRNYYPAESKTKRRNEKKKPKGSHLKKSLVPGTVCIIVAGPHKGKRVVFLKQIKESGLCLVTGPFVLNKCPLRRINQIYLIATRIHIKLNKYKVPQHIDDKYFKRTKPNKKKPKKGDTEIFAAKPKKYIPSNKRKVDQKTVDTFVLKAIKKRKDRTTLCAYMANKFSLKNHQYPHALKF